MANNNDPIITGISGFGGTTATFDISPPGPPFDTYSVQITPPYDPYTAHNSVYGDGLIFPLTEEQVRGELILIEKKFGSAEILKSYDQSFVDAIKKSLVQELAETILKNNLVEFTKQENMQTNEVTYRARAFVVPDGKVRQIRKNTK